MPENTTDQQPAAPAPAPAPKSENRRQLLRLAGFTLVLVAVLGFSFAISDYNSTRREISRIERTADNTELADITHQFLKDQDRLEGLKKRHTFDTWASLGCCFIGYVGLRLFIRTFTRKTQ